MSDSASDLYALMLRMISFALSILSSKFSARTAIEAALERLISINNDKKFLLRIITVVSLAASHVISFLDGKLWLDCSLIWAGLAAPAAVRVECSTEPSN